MTIKTTIWGAFGYVYLYRSQLTQTLFIPIALLIAFDFVAIGNTSVPLFYLLNILPIILYVLIAITTHRILLLGPESVSKWGVSMPGKRELFFILYSIGLAICLAPIGFLTLIPYIGGALSFVTMFYIAARVSLVFPAIATDRGWSFLDSWQATRHHQVLMLVVVAVFPLAIGIPEMLLSNIPYITPVLSLIAAMTMVLTIAALSVAFQIITKEASTPPADSGMS